MPLRLVKRFPSGIAAFSFAFLALGTALWVQLGDVGCAPPGDSWCWSLLWGWTRFALSLRWVENYQTLLATIGATSALWAVVLQQRWHRAVEIEKKRDASLRVIERALLTFKSLADVIRDQPLEQAEKELYAARQLLPRITDLHYGLSDLVRMGLDVIGKTLNLNGTVTVDLVQGDPLVLTRDEWAVLYASLWAGYFENGERLLKPDGRFQFIRQTAERAAVWGQPYKNVDVVRLPYLDSFYGTT